MLLSYLYRAGRGIAVVAALMALADTSVGAQTVTLKNNSPVAALQRWVAQIDAHVPGRRDAAVVAAAGLKPVERGLLVGIAGPFAFYLRDLASMKEPPRVRLSALEKTLVTALATKISAKETSSAWLHRAVMFETDVAIFAPEVTAEAMRDAKVSGMLEAIHAEDGELGARDLLNWHFQLARDLVDQRDPLASDTFAASWYHAVALYELDEMLLGEMGPHMLKAFQLFPADARIQFDDACLADAMGSARVQAVMIGLRPGGFRPSIPSLGSADLQATRQFARAMELDLTFAEPRVRLARLMEKNGKPGDALAALLALTLLCAPRDQAVAATQVRFSSRTVAVRVDVLATDNGKPVAGLTADDFELLDNNVPQQIEALNIGDLPVNAVVALDVSGSTEGQTIGDLVDAGDALIAALRPEERASLTTFSEVVAPRVPLTTDHQMVRQVLARVVPGGQTAILDGVFTAMMTAQSEDGRPLVVVFTDGLDTVSWMRDADLINATRRASAVIYTVATGPARQWQFLKDLATATGGRAISLGSAKSLQAEFLRILTEFRSRYVLSFSPKGVSETGYHQLTVRSKKRGAVVTARPGYTAGAAK